MSDWFQWAIVAFIVLSILFHVWKGGAGTGKLQHDVSNVRTQVTALGGKVEKLANLPSRVGEIEEEMKDLKNKAATTGDVARLEQVLEEKLKTVRVEMQAHATISEGTNRNVQRIYDIMLQKGLGK